MKKKIIFISLTIILVFSFIIVYLSKDNAVIASSREESKESSGMFAFMLETEFDSNEYKVATSSEWPNTDYEFNEELSYCENGSSLIWNDETNSVSLRTSVSDKCYLYFNIEPPDIYIANNNTDETFNLATPAIINCSGATSTYNNKYKRIEVSQVSNEKTTCTLTYEEPATKNYLNNHIIGLSGTTQGTGQVVNENGYRYEGKDPNNYIWFNNELWRIIGVFDASSHGQNGENLVKIIRNSSIGGLAWDKSDTNDWTTSSLMNLLNGAYYNRQNGTGGEYCYGHRTTIPSNCDYTEIGISDTYRVMIKNVTWYLGGYSSTTSATADAFYGYERGTTVYSGRPTSTTGHIGLMYVSDYGYSVLASSCARTTNLSDYDSATCAGQSWLYGRGYDWTITPYSSDGYYVFNVSGNGYLNGNIADFGHAVRPTLYLDSSVYVIDGNGSISDPYIIGM